MISVIIPAHNEKRNLEKLIPLLLANSKFASCEIIVSLSSENSDQSEEILQNFNVIVLRCSKKGRAIQMNEAVARCKGDIIAFLHADVIPPATFLSDIQKTIAAGYEAGFFSYRFDTDNFFLKVNATFTARDGIFTGGGDQCLFIKKALFEQLGAFDENQVVMEDFEFFDRMKEQKVRYKIVKSDLVVSARKYKNNPYLRVNLSNLLLLTLFKMGYPSKKLKSLHNKLLNTSY